MGFFVRLLGQDENQKAYLKAAIREEINISDAINAHMKWKRRLQNYLDGTSEEKLYADVIGMDNQCVLGKWIHGTGMNHFRNDEGFAKLRSDHASFHLIAGEVVRKVQANDKAGAVALIQSEYAQASRDVIHDLAELNNQLNP